MMKVTVTGLGHVGLIQAVAMATLGHQVLGIDNDLERVEKLQGGVPPFHEPGLHAEMTRQVNADRLRFTSDPGTAYETADVIFLCVGTPPRDDGSANLIALENAARDIRECAKRHAVVVEKSTVPPGTHERLKIALNYGRTDLVVASNPEFLREGTALKDTMNPDRIVVGSDSGHAHRVLRDAYSPLIETGTRYIETDVATAELSKHASNSFLSTKISFINAIALLCERTGADVTKVAEIMGADPRIGPAFLNAGLGYGGFCFPKDVAALASTFEKNDIKYGSLLLDDVQKINDEMIYHVIAKVEDDLWHLEGKRIALLGLAFKPGTDDTRFSPAVELVNRLEHAGADVVAWDPQVTEVDGSSSGIVDHLLIALDGADIVVVATEHPEIRTGLMWNEAARRMKGRTVIDARNLFTDQDESIARMYGFTIVGVGR
jgi:UDPglucose 6-dehydrogenase